MRLTPKYILEKKIVLENSFAGNDVHIFMNGYKKLVLAIAARAQDLRFPFSLSHKLYTKTNDKSYESSTHQKKNNNHKV